MTGAFDFDVEKSSCNPLSAFRLQNLGGERDNKGERVMESGRGYEGGGGGGRKFFQEETIGMKAEKSESNLEKILG